MKSVAILLCILIAFPALQAQTFPTELNIVVVEGDGATNNVRQRVARSPAIRVEDEGHKPVAGVAVVFTLPTEGATGEFGNGAKTLTVLTDREGLAAAEGLRMNPVAGKIPIHINASYRGLTARASMTQYSVLPPGAKPPKAGSGGGGHGTLIAVLVVLGGAAAGGGAYLATHSKSTPSTTPTPPAGPTPIGISAGTGSIAGGR